MEVTLSKPIKPGFRRAFEVGTDEPVDKQVDGKYARSAVVEGDSSAPTIDPGDNPQKITGWINGDGALGSKAVDISVDAHVGDADVPLTLTVRYEVASSDATAFVGFKEGADEVIPV